MRASNSTPFTKGVTATAGVPAVLASMQATNVAIRSAAAGGDVVVFSAAYDAADAAIAITPPTRAMMAVVMMILMFISSLGSLPL
jgi:hypothetical protein